MRTTLLIAGFAGLALLAGCRGSPEPPEGPRWVELTPGTTISTEATAGGETKLVVVVPEGRADAGTYTSTSPHFVALARDLMERLGQPGVRVSIEVTPAREILKIRDSATKL